jgi:hypothetical protein
VPPRISVAEISRDGIVEIEANVTVPSKQISYVAERDAPTLSRIQFSPTLTDVEIITRLVGKRGITSGEYYQLQYQYLNRWALVYSRTNSCNAGLYNVTRARQASRFTIALCNGTSIVASTLKEGTLGEYFLMESIGGSLIGNMNSLRVTKCEGFFFEEKCVTKGPQPI